MKRTNIDVAALVDVLSGALPKTRPVGYAKNAHGQFLVAFVATDGVTGDFITAGVTGERYTLNWRISRRQE